MEMFYRRRSKKPHQTAAAEPPPVNHVPPSTSSRRCTLLSQDTHFLFSDDGNNSLMQNHIETGYLYEIDHAHLPPRTPVQLRCIRVAMVCEKTDMNVTVRFPSMESLRAFFNFSTRETHTALDEKFVMGTILAEKVLLRLIPEVIFAEQKDSVGFWLINPSDDDGLDNVVVTRKKGSCLSEALKGNGMVRWGVRRQVKYLGRHKSDGNLQNSSSSFVDGVLEESQMELGGGFDEREKSGEEDGEGNGDDVGSDDDVVEEEDGEEEEEEDEVTETIDEESNKNLKRKRYSFRNLGMKKGKKAKVEMIRKQKQQKKQKMIQAKKKKNRMRSKEELIQRDPKERWSAERYKLAEKNLLVVMKQKEATAEKPILRPQLRAEARKTIGDTGLLDHLLKHMAGKIAPGGEERFRRRHNPDGAMEYWLESADLVNIRNEAGVTDPYWVPPPGWKPGDSPTQDPICARELKLIRDDISSIKRDLELRATNMQLEEEVARLRRTNSLTIASLVMLQGIEISSKRRAEENQAITGISAVSDRSEISQRLDKLVSSLESSKCDLEAQVSLEKYKEQLMVVSDFVKEIEDKIEKLSPKQVEERPKAASSLMVQQATAELREEVQALTAGEEREEAHQFGKQKDEKKSQIEEEKAAKIKRLKSGFRICKPQGTFLWPDMVKDNSNINSSSSSVMSTTQQVFVQVEVPTPPSVSSATTAAPQLHHHLYPPAVVKPVAEKRAVTVTVSTLSKPPNYDANTYSISTTSTPLVDLNDEAPNLTAMQEPNLRGWDGRNGHGMMGYNDPCCCSSSATSEVGNWLALSTLKSASDDSSHG